MDKETRDKRRAAKEVVDVLEEISMLLNTGLTRTQLSLAISLIENGVNPEALAAVIKALRAEGERAVAGSDSQEESSE